MKKKRANAPPDRAMAMGDIYKVYRDSRGLWCSKIFYKDGRSRVCCSGSPLIWVARDVYFENVQTAQNDALDGRNPYISATQARAYKCKPFE